MRTALPVTRCLLTALLVTAGLADAHAFETTDTRDGVTLHYRDASDALAAPVRERIIETVFGAYLRGLVKALDGALREGRYTPALWETVSGTSLPGLWAQYVR